MNNLEALPTGWRKIEVYEHDSGNRVELEQDQESGGYAWIVTHKHAPAVGFYASAENAMTAVELLGKP